MKNSILEISRHIDKAFKDKIYTLHNNTKVDTKNKLQVKYNEYILI